jgi:multidrug transporter EmrE-like cation transporter
MAWVIAGSFIGSFGAVGLKAGAKRLEKNILALITNWRLIGGVFAYLLSSVFFVRGIKQGELSILYPLVSVGSLWTLVWSRLFFDEPFTRAKLSGIGLILIGVALLGLGTSH